MKRYYLFLLLVWQLSSSLLLADPFVVKNIHFIGLQRIAKDAVLQAMPIQVGKSFNVNDSTELIKAIFNTGFFNNISLAREGDTLIVTVVERPTIAKLELLGIKNTEAIDKILKEANLVKGRVFEAAKLIKVEQDIEHYYLSKGNYGVKVQTKVVNKKRNRVNVVISIYEGDEAKIKKINITGNKFFTEKELLKQLLHAKTNWTSWYTKDNRYAKEKHLAELELLHSFYLDRGYLNFQVESSQVSLSPNKKDVYITINVTEGEKYFFGNFTLAGKFVVAKETLQQLIAKKLHTGMVFSRKVLLEIQKDLELYLGNYGYGNAQVRLNVANNDELKKINIEFFVEPGDRLTVRKINIIGNKITQDKVLRHGIEQMEGSWVSTKEIQEGKDYMMREGYANNVELKNKPVLGKKDQIDVIYKMEEQRTAQFNAGIAYSASEKFGYNLGADIRNFLGTGKNLNFAFDKSKVTESYSFGYFDPIFTNDGIGMGFNLYKRKINVSKTSHIFDYGIDSVGGDVNWSFPITKYDYFLFGCGIDNSKLKITQGYSTPNEAKAFVQKQGDQFKEYNVSLGWRHNSLDQYIFPTKGLYQRAIVKTTMPASTLKYYSINYENSWYYPITEKYIVNLSSEFGYMANYKHGQYFPFFKHFYAGGADSIRGFSERSLGPKDSKNQPFGGNVLVLAKAAVIFPAPFFAEIKTVRTAAFFDAGQVYDTNYNYNYNPVTGDKLDKQSKNSHGLRYSLGLSFTWHSPLGVPLVISIAKPLNAKKTDDKHYFAFTFGTMF